MSGLRLVKPPRLRRGDRVAAISLSWGGPGAAPARYAAGKRQLEDEFGVTVVETRHALRDPDWLRRNPRARADDTQMDFGHTDPFFVLPYGVQAEIDCGARRFSLLESGVT